MHDSVLKWVNKKVIEYDLENRKVLEVGSLNVNGSVREFFKGEYTGIDMQSGLGVDKIMNAHELEFNDGEFDVVISTEMLEHDDEFWKSLKEMARVLKSKGYLIITTRGNGFPEHGNPNDYYRFMPQSLDRLFQIFGIGQRHITTDTQYAGIFGIGVKI